MMGRMTSRPVVKCWGQGECPGCYVCDRDTDDQTPLVRGEGARRRAVKDDAAKGLTIVPAGWLKAYAS